MKIGSTRSILLFLAVLLLSLGTGCRHAWVRYAQTPPAICTKYPGSIDCQTAQKVRAANESRSGEKHVLHLSYFFFGLYPRVQLIDMARYCPAGPRSVHQYTSLQDGFLEQLTFTVYSPATLEIECYP